MYQQLIYKRGDFMAQINFRVDDDLKRNAERTFDDMGINMSTALNIFLKRVVRENRIPFELSGDPFYSEENLSELKKRITEIESGKAILKEHELVEVDE